MKIRIRQRKEGIDDTVLNVEDVKFVALSNDNPPMRLALYFSEDCKKVEITNGLNDVSMTMSARPIANVWEAKISPED